MNDSVACRRPASTSWLARQDGKVNGLEPSYEKGGALPVSDFLVVMRGIGQAHDRMTTFCFAYIPMPIVEAELGFQPRQPRFSAGERGGRVERCSGKPAECSGSPGWAVSVSTGGTCLMRNCTVLLFVMWEVAGGEVWL